MVEDILENISQRKYRFIFFIIIVIVIICSVYFYQKSQEHFEDEELFEDAQKTENTSSNKNKFAFIKEKTCEDTGYLQIKDVDTCKAAAKQINPDWKYKFKQIEDSFEGSRPKGCAKHPIGNLDFFGPDKSSGAANVTGYSGVYCIQKEVNTENNLIGFDKWIYDKQKNLDKTKNINCENINNIKKTRYQKIIKNLTKRNKKIESKISKMNDKIDTTTNKKKKENYESIKKKFQKRQTKVLEITGKVQQIINSLKNETEDSTSK
jgi:hypothetical protein